jgi:hypothetical protein
LRLFYNNLFLGLALLTLSLGFFSILGYSFSLANFTILFFFYYYLKSNNKFVYISYLSIIAYFLILALLFFDSLKFIEFLKSFLLTSIMLLVFISSLNKPIKNENFNLQKVITIIGVIIVLFELIQISEFLIFGTSNSWFVLDKFSISTATDISRFQAVNFLSFMRPISFYHEPSYLGIVLLIFLICANELKVKQIFIYIYIIGILISFSTTALLFLILYLIIKNFNNIKNFTLIFFTILILSLFFIDQDILNNVFRFSEIFNAGTSGNERLIGPLDFLIDQFYNKHHYFGIPLGQSDLVFNNSFYLLFLYFGILTPFILFIFIGYIVFKFKSNSLKYLLAFFSLLFLSGAIFTLEDALILYLLNYTFNASLKNKTSTNFNPNISKINFNQ